MPLYEYQCKQCNYRFEKIKKYSDPPETQCPKCDGEIEQLLSAPAVQFKGQGWYVTDYAKKGRTSKNTSSDSPSSGSESGTKSESSESKPAETPKKTPEKKSE